MIAAVPLYALAPLEYRLALDAAGLWLAGHLPLRLLCEQPALLPECRARLPFEDQPPWRGLLWLEPQQETWSATLPDLAAHLPTAARLALLLSLPPSRYLPESRSWPGAPLGPLPGGLQSLLSALHQHGFTIEVAQAIHTRRAVAGNALARLARRLGRHALADRLEFAARRHYVQPLQRSWQAACALLLASRR